MGTSTSSASAMARCVASRSTSIGARMGMKARRGAARGFEPLGEPLDAVGVLGMQHGHCAVLARDVQHVEDLAVVELHVVVGHVDLERGEALGISAGNSSFSTVGVGSLTIRWKA
jgi:hypothetical protein